MRFNTIVMVIGIAAVGLAILILIFSGNDESQGPMTPAAQGRRLFRMQGCNTCHAIGGGISRGPDLAGVIPKLEMRLATPAYQQHLAELQNHDPDIYKTFEPVYTNILSHTEGEDRLRAWIAAHLNNPRFDHYDAKMPAFSYLTPEQVEQLTAFLLTLR